MTKKFILKTRSGIAHVVLAMLVCAGARADTITVNTNAVYYATTYSSPTTVQPTNAVFAYYGFRTAVLNGAVYTTGISSVPEMDKCPPEQILFSFTGTNFELIINPFSSTVNGAYASPYFTLSDGQTTTIYTNMPPFVRNNSDIFYVPVTFGNNITHHLKLSLKGGFGGINVTSGSCSGYVPATKPNLWIDGGDSYVEGYNPTVSVDGSASFWFDGFVWQVMGLQANTIVVPCGVSGTGFYNTNSSTGDLPYTWRMTNDVWGLYTNAVASGLYGNIFISWNGTINDLGAPTNAVFQNATNVLAQTKAHCPQASVFLIGNWLGVGGESSPSPNDYALEWAMTNAAAATGMPVFDPIPANLKNGGNYYTFYPPGSGTDSVHPSAAGYAIYAAFVNSNLTAAYGAAWTNSSGNVFPAPLLLPLHW